MTETADRPPSRSGRRTVAALVAVVLVGWFGLDRAFRAWTARYEARARFGATAVAPSVDPLAALAPAGLDPAEWRRAVADTHAMLLALTGSGVLGDDQLVALRRHLAEQVARARAHPEAARVTLGRVWDDAERDAGPVIAPDLVPPPPNSRHAHRHPRPPRPSLLVPPSRRR